MNGGHIAVALFLALIVAAFVALALEPSTFERCVDSATTAAELAGCADVPR